MSEQNPQDEPAGAEVAFECPACHKITNIWTPVSPYYVMTGPSLTCIHCDAIIAVELRIVIPGRGERGKDVAPGEAPDARRAGEAGIS